MLTASRTEPALTKSQLMVFFPLHLQAGLYPVWLCAAAWRNQGFAFPDPSSTIKGELVLVTGWLQLWDVTPARSEAGRAWLGLTPERVYRWRGSTQLTSGVFKSECFCDLDGDGVWKKEKRRSLFKPEISRHCLFSYFVWMVCCVHSMQSWLRNVSLTEKKRKRFAQRVLKGYSKTYYSIRVLPPSI